MADPLAVVCPKCHAIAGFCCQIWREGAVTGIYGQGDYHAARVRAAKKADKEKSK